MNHAILAAARALPVGSGYRFEPVARPSPADPHNPRDPKFDGVSRDLYYGAERVAAAAPDGATYCCGITFEAYFDACMANGNAIGTLDADGVRAMIADWFCPVMGHGGAADALVSRGLGRPVQRAEAQPGDLCQFWRSTDLAKPSGHSVVFLGWEASRLRYWSSQPATEGVGVHVEEVGPRWEVHLARALRL